MKGAPEEPAHDGPRVVIERVADVLCARVEKTRQRGEEEGEEEGEQAAGVCVCV